MPTRSLMNSRSLSGSDFVGRGLVPDRGQGDRVRDKSLNPIYWLFTSMSALLSSDFTARLFSAIPVQADSRHILAL